MKNLQTINLKLGNTEINKNQKGDRKIKNQKKREEDQSSSLTF